MISRAHVTVWLLCMLVPAIAGQEAPAGYEASIRQERERRVDRLRTGDFSPLKKVRIYRLRDAGRMTIGSAPASDIRLEDSGVAATHAVVEGLPDRPVLKPLGGRVHWTWNNEERQEWVLKHELGLRIGRFGVRFWDSGPSGFPSLQVFDPDAPAMKAFRGLEFFPIDTRYRVSAEVIAHPQPQRVNLLDSAAREQSWWIYGEARFTVDGVPCVLELYTQTLDEARIRKEGFMLMFTDATSGTESYPSTRYVTIEGRSNGTVLIDFNRATTPPCDFSPLYSCPFPRRQNRLPVAIRAGEKWYSSAGERHSSRD